MERFSRIILMGLMESRKSILLRGRLQGDRYRMGHDKRNRTGLRGWKMLVLNGVGGPGAKESRRPLEAGKGEEMGSALELKRKHSPADLFQAFQTPDRQS